MSALRSSVLLAVLLLVSPSQGASRSAAAQEASNGLGGAGGAAQEPAFFGEVLSEEPAFWQRLAAFFPDRADSGRAADSAASFMGRNHVEASGRSHAAEPREVEDNAGTTASTVRTDTGSVIRTEKASLAPAPVEGGLPAVKPHGTAQFRLAETAFMKRYPAEEISKPLSAEEIRNFWESWCGPGGR